MKQFSKFLLMFLVFFSPMLLLGQIRINVIDKELKSPIPNVHVKIIELDKSSPQYIITNLDGYVNLDGKPPLVIQLSFVGYKTLIDTIEKSGSYNLELEPNVLDLDQFVVTGQFTPSGTDQSVYKIKVIDRKDIALKGAVTLEDVLASEANISISQDGVFGSNLNLQGIGGENIKILIDGVPMIGRLDGKLDLSQINLNDVERIEVVEGPMSVSYGSNALGGVINIITKSHVGGKVNHSFSTYAESIGKFNVNGNFGITKKKNTFLLSGGRNFFKGYDAGDTTRMLQWKPKEQYFAKFKYKRRFGTTNLTYASDYFNEFVLDKGNPVLNIDTLNNYYFYEARDGYYNTNRFNNQLSLNGIVKKKYYINLIAAHSIYNRRKEVYIKNLYTQEKESSTALQDNDTTSFRNLLFKGELSRFTADTAKFNYQIGYDVNIERAFGKKIEEGEQRIDDYAVFLGLKYTPFKNFEIQPAVRAAYNSKYDAPITPALNIKFTPGLNTQIRASYARGFRAPSLKELYLDFVDLNHKIYGNPELKAEYSNNITANLSYSSTTGQHSYRWELDAFYNKINSMINLIPQFIIEGTDTTQIYIYSNIDEYLSQGGRISLRYKRLSNLECKLALAVVGRNQNLSESQEQKIHYRPEIASSLKWNYPHMGTTFLLVYKYNGKSLIDALDVNEELITYTENAYHQFDVTMNKPFFDQKLNLTLGAKNLFNVTNISIVGNTSTGGIHTGGASARPVGYGRTFFISLNYKINK